MNQAMLFALKYRAYFVLAAAVVMAIAFGGMNDGGWILN